MSDKEAEVSAAEETEAAEQPQGTDDDTPLAQAPEESASELDLQVQELQNRLLRTQADFDNFRRRARTEKEELSKFATAKLLTELLPVLDNFGLALGAETQDADSLKKGIEMVYRQLQTVLEHEGLAPLEAVGKSFDPNYHEAVMQVEQEGTEPGIVVEELRKGYLLKDKVIRPAMVKVSI